MNETMTLSTTEHQAHGLSEKVYFGFWLYLMTDLIVFSVLFACFAVLRNNTFGGPSGKDLFDLPFALTETLILLTSSFICGLGMIAARHGQKIATMASLGLTILLGASFLLMEIYEFGNLIRDGHTWTKSAFLSSFFTLVGTHGLHIAIGLLWSFILLIYIANKGLNDSALRKMTWFSVFWHFLDVVWIFIFTIVYLMGVS